VDERWAYLGPEGTFTEQAVQSVLQRTPDVSVELMPAVGVSAALEALRGGAVDAACVPLENSVEGGVPLIVGNQVIGAIGASGGMPTDDGAVANAGAAGLQP
jgi:hypothetical protein